MPMHNQQQSTTIRRLAYSVPAIILCFGTITQAAAYDVNNCGLSAHPAQHTTTNPTSSAPKLQSAHPTIYWQTIRGNTGQYKLPSHALPLGYNQAGAIYACNADYQDGSHPGQYTPKGCLITFAGETILLPKFKILCGNHLYASWYSRSSFQQMQSAANTTNSWGYKTPGISASSQLHLSTPVVGGYESQTGSYDSYANRGNNNVRELYICRGILNDRIHLGKVVSGYCNTAYQHKEYMLKSYQVLFHEYNPLTIPADADSVTINGNGGHSNSPISLLKRFITG